MKVKLNFIPSGAHKSGTTISSATELKPADAAGAGNAEAVLIQALTQNVRFTLDGTDPTTSLGCLLTAGNDPILIPYPPGTTLKVIEAAATASIQYQWGNLA